MAWNVVVALEFIPTLANNYIFDFFVFLKEVHITHAKKIDCDYLGISYTCPSQ